MPRTMELRDSPAVRKLPATILALVLALAFVPAASGAEEYRLVVTGNQYPLYPVMTDEPPVEDPTSAYEEELRSLREEHPDAFFVEAGGFSSFDSVLETGYNSRPLQFFNEMDYAAVRLSARDAAMQVVGSSGLHYAPDSVLDRVISNLDLEADSALGLSGYRLAENPAGQRMHFQSISSLRTAQGLGDRVTFLIPEEWGELRTVLESALQEEPAPVVAVGDLSPEEWAEFAGEGGAPVSLYLNGAMDPDAEPTLRDGVWHIPAPGLGDAHVVTFRYREAELDGEPELERVPLFTPALRREDLYNYPIPRAGLPITNLESVMAQFFSVPADAVRQDRLDAESLEDLTITPRPIVYHLEGEEGSRRLYRLMSMMPNYHRPGYFAPGWPEVHALVVLNDDHSLDRVVSRLRFPIAGLDTTLLEALNRLPGTPQEEWQPDPELAAGIEEGWQWLVTDIRRIMELDRQLYGPGGLYYLPEED